MFDRYFPVLRSTAVVLVLTGVALAATGGVAYVANSVSTLVAIAMVCAVPVVAAVILKPRLGMLILLLVMCTYEEFPGGLAEDESGRGARTLFYSTTVGLPAVYIPDVLIFGVLALYLIKSIVWRERFPLRLDKISIALLLIAVAVVASVIASSFGEQTWGPPVLDLTSVMGIDIPRPVARLIAILQYKLFVLIFPAYLLGMYFFQSEKDVDDLLKIILIAMLLSIGIGIFRIIEDPSRIALVTPIIYDTATIWLMALTVFFFVSKWSLGYYDQKTTLILVLLCGMLSLQILLSFRRTLWGAIAIAVLFLPLIVPKRGWPPILTLILIGFSMAVLALGSTGAGRTVLMSVLERLIRTDVSADASTLYRFTIMLWTVENIWDMPWFGFGLKPLWNETISLRWFIINMENVHSLYFWVLLRTGIVGSLLCGFAFVLILLRMREVFLRMKSEHYRIIVGVAFLGFIMYMFSGVFNPVYGRVRFMVPMGLMLALITQLPHIVGRDPPEMAEERDRSGRRSVADDA